MISTLTNLKKLIFIIAISCFTLYSPAQTDPRSPSPDPDECTSITAGKLATADGSVITSHTDDSHRTRSWMDIVPPAKHEKGSMVPMYKRSPTDSLAMPSYAHVKIGEIPQLPFTYGYINTAYPCINEYQLAIGETTFGGKRELRSDEGLIDCPELYRLALERAKTAREAILVIDKLTKEYGYNDVGECFKVV